MNHPLAVIYTTVETLDQAKDLARQAVEAKHAACANIFPGSTSFYVWEGALSEGQECVVIFKTSLEKATSLQEWLSQNHPYDVPAILQWTAEASASYADFVKGG